MSSLRFHCVKPRQQTSHEHMRDVMYLLSGFGILGIMHHVTDVTTGKVQPFPLESSLWYALACSVRGGVRRK